ncbi:trigger factor [Lachnospiraceae bacterium]|nr:trigger factor [Lachnospiraceae bacterium]
MKKKILVLLLAAGVMALTGGCGDKEQENSKQDNVQDDSEDGSQESGAVSQPQQVDYDVEKCVKLGDYMGLEISLGSYEVTDEDVKNNIESMLSSYPAYEDTDKTTVEEGDIANIDYEGLKDGVAFEGGTAQGANLEIGSDSFIDGFEDGLIGKKVGEKVALDLTFPEEYGNTELAGQAVVFNVTVNKIVKKVDMTYDTLTDAYVADNFVSQGYNNVEELKKGVRGQLESNNETNKQSDTQNELLKQLRTTCEIEVPKELLDTRIQEYKQRVLANVEASNMTMEDYYTQMQTTEDDFNEQVKQMIQESLENQLLLEAIAKKENISADEDGYEEYVKSVVTDFNFESEEALIEQYGEDYVKNAYVSDKTMELLIDNAKITYDGKNDTAEKEDAQGAKDSGDDTEKETEKAE